MGPVDVGVNLGGGNVRMAEQFLNDPQISPAFEEMRRKGMAKRVGTDVIFQTSNPAIF